MISIQLKRSGGQLGKSLHATRDVDLEEADVVKELKQIAPAANPQARDDFYHSVSINGGESFPIDMSLLKGDLKKIITGLENDLKV